MNALIALLGILVAVCVLFAAWIGMTERGGKSEDWFRKHWGGSDAKIFDNSEDNL